MMSGRVDRIGIVCAVFASGTFAHAQAPGGKTGSGAARCAAGAVDRYRTEDRQDGRGLSRRQIDFKPTPDVRTFADVMRHVAFWNLYVQKTARGEKLDAKQNELPKAEYPTKDQDSSRR